VFQQQAQDSFAEWRVLDERQVRLDALDELVP
jgi:hypothetical protein